MENWLNYAVIALFIIISFFVVSYFILEKNNIQSGTSESQDPNNSQNVLKTKEIEIKGSNFTLEIADTSMLRATGLMNRSSMDENKGMLFDFEQSSYHGFCMKNTLSPLDLIWINTKGEVIYIKENAQPCSTLIGAVCSSMVPTKISKYVVELNAGQVAALGLKIGDTINIDL